MSKETAHYGFSGNNSQDNSDYNINSKYIKNIHINDMSDNCAHIAHQVNFGSEGEARLSKRRRVVSARQKHICHDCDHTRNLKENKEKKEILLKRNGTASNNAGDCDILCRHCNKTVDKCNKITDIFNKGMSNRDNNKYNIGTHKGHAHKSHEGKHCSDFDSDEAYCELGMAVDKHTKCKEIEAMGIIDSGASHHMSPRREHFVKLIDKCCSLRVADRVMPVKAQYGYFRENSLKLKTGLYHPELSNLLISVYRQREQGNAVRFDKINEIVDNENNIVHEFHFIESLPRIEVHFHWKEPDSNMEEHTALRAAKTSVRDKFLAHVRNAHFYSSCVGQVSCSACMMSKDHGGASHRAERPEYTKPRTYLEQVNWDFSGQWPKSLTGKTWLLVAVDDFIDWIEAYALESKDKAGSALDSFINDGPGRMDRNRSDNAPEFRGADSGWVKKNKTKFIRVTYSQQYEPETNGKAERFVRTLGNAVRAVMEGVDVLLWEFAPGYVSHTWNRLDRKSGQKSPYCRINNGREPKTHYFRRFGCLCYAKVHVLKSDKELTSKVARRYEPGVFLGYNKNSTYKVGVWHRDARVATGWRFNVMENRTVKFDESRLVGDINDLRSRGSFVSFALPDALRDSVLEAGDVGPPGSHEPGLCASSPSPRPFSKVDDNAVANADGSPATSEVNLDSVNSDPPIAEPLRMGVDASENKESVLTESHTEKEGISQDQPSFSEEINDEEEIPRDPRIYVDENGITRKRRGRLPGAKAKSHWKKTGPKSSKNKASVQLVESSEKDKAMELRDKESETEMWKASEEELMKELKDEQAISYTVQLTHKKCMEAEDANEWIEADNLERVKLEAKKCWREVQDSDKFDYSKDEVIPIVTIYSRKRCGRYKCRAVALGNRQTNCSKAEIYSPTVSHACNRYLSAHAAANGHHILQFDITLAFINSTLDDDRVFCRLPKHWGGEKVRLLRALYGLKVSPRKWFDTYRAFLESVGWTMNESEPGLFSKGEMLLSIYVDDSLIAGPDADGIKKEMETILNHFKGEEVKPTKVHTDGTEERDLLGATLLYNQKKRFMLIHMRGAIEKVLKKFNMTGCRGVSTPFVPHTDLSGGGANEAFPMRQLCGCLIYIATICRPDISFACQRVAQFADKCTNNAIAAGKRILKYLSRTLEQGVSYSPENETAFRETYTKVLQEHNKDMEDYKELPDNVAFTDADFCGCTITLKSTSGSSIYYRGCPIVWRSKKQSIRTHSTCESEYVSMYDCIRLCQEQGYLKWFLENNRELPLIFSDNQSALALSKTSVATKKSKHYALRYMLVRDYFQNFGYVPTELNLSDPLTKPLPRRKYIQIFDHCGGKVEEESEESSLAECYCVDIRNLA